MNVFEVIGIVGFVDVFDIVIDSYCEEIWECGDVFVFTVDGCNVYERGDGFFCGWWVFDDVEIVW